MFVILKIKKTHIKRHSLTNTISEKMRGRQQQQPQPFQQQQQQYQRYSQQLPPPPAPSFSAAGSASASGPPPPGKFTLDQVVAITDRRLVALEKSVSQILTGIDQLQQQQYNIQQQAQAQQQQIEQQTQQLSPISLQQTQIPLNPTFNTEFAADVEQLKSAIIAIQSVLLLNQRKNTKKNSSKKQINDESDDDEGAAEKEKDEDDDDDGDYEEECENAIFTDPYLLDASSSLSSSSLTTATNIDTMREMVKQELNMNSMGTTTVDSLLSQQNQQKPPTKPRGKRGPKKASVITAAATTDFVSAFNPQNNIE